MRLSERFIKANNKMCSLENHVPAPYFRKSFVLDFIPTRAEITVCGLGFYELYINGENITKGPLAPYISNPADVCYYDNYQIADFLREGENVIGLWLGNGFQNPFGGFVWDFDKAQHIGPVTVAFCLEAADRDKSIVMESDESVKTHPSPITFDDIRMGCHYDARLELPDWNMPGYDDHTWTSAIMGAAPKGEKRLCVAEPIVVTEELEPVEIKYFETLPYAYRTTLKDDGPVEHTIRKDVYVFDFGKNGAGVSKLKINGEAGQVIIIRHGEYADGDRYMVNTTTFSAPQFIERYLEYGQTDVYICKGGEEEFIPRFKYDGFHFVYVEGLKAEQVKKDTVTFLAMNSNLKARADFSCSDEVINQLQKMTRRADLSNFYYFPTDCPHREKNGWTGDAAVSAEHMLLNLTVENSLAEWLVNIRAAQKENGMLPGIVPTGGWGYYDGVNGPAWDKVILELPYQIYRFTGDKSIISDNAEAIHKYLNYAMSHLDDKGLLAYGLGDWKDPNENVLKKIAAPLEVTDSAIVYYIAEKAEFLFHEAEFFAYEADAKRVKESLREAIRRELIDWDTMTVKGNCQTSQVLALAYGIFDEAEVKQAAERLLEIIHRDGDINACGMIGIRHLFHVLADIGECDLALKIITSTHPHCYGHWVEMGMTALCESFTSFDVVEVDSRNHHFLGDISNWFIGSLAGIRPNPDATDVSHFEIAPHFAESLSYVNAYYEHRTGRVSVNWRRESGKVLFHVKTPVDTYGEIILPKGFRFKNGNRIMEWSGKQSIEKELILWQKQE